MTWAPPATYTERADIGSFGGVAVATKQLASGAPTGTLQFTNDDGELWEYFGFTVAITEGAFDQTITGAGNIASAEAFGGPQLNLSISTEGAASGEAFGNLVITTPQPQAIVAEGIVSGEAFGTLTTVLYLGASGIATAEAFGSPRLSALIGPAGIASGEAFGSTNVAIEQFITPVGVVSGEVFGTTALQIGYPQTVIPTGITSGELVEDPFARLLYRLLLVNPSIQETPAAWDRLHIRFGIHRGITIIKDADGVWSSVRYPAQTEIEAALKVYMGGRRHALTVDEAEELTAAGYGDYIELELSE